jgi:hypothetical protein
LTSYTPAGSPPRISLREKEKGKGNYTHVRVVSLPWNKMAVEKKKKKREKRYIQRQIGESERKTPLA